MTTTEQGAPSAILLTDEAIANVAMLPAEENEPDPRFRVAVRIDTASAPHPVGVTLNYVDALQGAGFSIDNPNAQRSCGFGQSFS